MWSGNRFAARLDVSDIRGMRPPAYFIKKGINALPCIGDGRQAELKANGGFKYPKSQTPWQEIQRKTVDDLAQGMVLKNAVKYRRIVRTHGTPRDNH